MAPMSTDRRDPSNAFGHQRFDREVRELMRPGVITLSAHASLRQVQRAIASHGVHAVLVVDTDSGTPLGWVTARALLAHVTRDLDLVTAGSVVSEPAVTIPPSATVREALAALLASEGSRLLVCPAGHNAAEGVVTDLDLVRLLAAPHP